MTAIWKKRLIALILVAIAALVSYELWRAGVLARISDKNELVNSLRVGGVKGPLLCVAVQFVQVVIFVIPGEITQFAAGYVFGAWLGFLYSIIGIMLGSAFNFFFARVFGRPALEKFIPGPTLEKIDRALNNAKGKSAMFLLFLLPGLPKDALSYGAGLSNMGLAEFVIISGLGRSPAMLATTLGGALAYQRQYRGMIIVAAVAGLAIGAYFLYERRRGRAAKS
jgi:uncharacterized membrane protein YdjX (TVP38/TMEM64 family)